MYWSRGCSDQSAPKLSELEEPSSQRCEMEYLSNVTTVVKLAAAKMIANKYMNHISALRPSYMNLSCGLV